MGILSLVAIVVFLLFIVSLPRMLRSLGVSLGSFIRGIQQTEEDIPREVEKE